MLKIAVITRYFPSSGEPAQGRSLYETLRLVARTAEVQVFYPNAAYPSLLKPRSRLYDKLDPAFNVPHMSVNYYDYLALPLVSRPLNGWMSYHTLMPHVRAFAPDLVFGCFLYPAGFTALKIGKSLGVPVVAMSIGSDINRMGDPICTWLTKSVLREADFLVTVCDDLRKKAVAEGARSATARSILNGCDLDIFHVFDRYQARQQLKIDPDIEAVVYVGGIDVKKGLRELVEAAAALHADRPALHFFLVGSGPDRSLIEELIHSRNAAGYIHFAGGCTFNEVAIWMAAANLFTLPSYMEGCPNVVLEALACGRPVVATNVGGIPEIMSNACGRLVPPRQPGPLAEAIADVLDRSWDPAAISAQWSRSWSAPAAELLDIFESVASNRPRVSTAG